MQDDSSTTPPAATVSTRTTRWNPVLPFIVSVIGSFTFIFAAGTTLSGAITTFALCFAVAYLTQVVFGRFFVALALFDTVSTTDARERCKDSRTGVSRESKS